MPTKDPVKNREYVKKSNEKKKAQVGAEEYNKYFAANENKYRTNKKEKIGVDEYRKKQAEYMKQYRLKKKEGDKKQNAINTLTDAIRARKARKELLNRATERANAAANELTNKAQKEVKEGSDKQKRKRGRPAKKVG
jgi:hypothetical protein